jgi:hypothetical protein
MTTTDASGNPTALINESLTSYQAILETINSPLSFPEPLSLSECEVIRNGG